MRKKRLMRMNLLLQSHTSSAIRELETTALTRCTRKANKNMVTQKLPGARMGVARHNAQSVYVYIEDSPSFKRNKMEQHWHHDRHPVEQ